MRRGGEQWRLASTTFAAVVLLSGCSGTSHDVAADASATTSAPSSAAPSRPVSPTPSPEAPAPGHLATPGTSAGPLSRSSFPRPKALGAGWRYSVDPGDAEEGYLGNGTPAVARDPQEVVQTALPFGCPRDTALPLPRHALEVDYTFRHTKVVAVRMAFSGAAAASAFYGRRKAGLAGCRGHSGGAAIGRLVTRVVPLGASAVLSDRTPGSDPWSELAVVTGSDVVLVAAHTAPGRPPLAGRQARALARAFDS